MTFYYEAAFSLEQDLDDGDLLIAQKWLDEHSPSTSSSMKRELSESGFDDTLISDIIWDLKDVSSGTISFESSIELDDDYLVRLGQIALGQASDGIGESFEQQDFATHEWCPLLCDYVDAYHSCGRFFDCEGCDGQPETVMSSFDWRGKNTYHFGRK